MRNRTKIWLFIAATLLLTGCILFGVAMTMLKWNFGGLSTVKYVTKEYEIVHACHSVFVVTDTADITFLPAEDDKIRVICYERENEEHGVVLRDGMLCVQLESRKWYEQIGINFDSPKVTVYLPAGSYDALTVKVSTGDVEIPADFGFGSLDISATTGHVTNRASATGAMKIKTSTGGISLEGVSAGSLALSLTTGKMTINDTDCAGDMMLTVTTGKTGMENVRCESLTATGTTGSITMKNVIAAGAISVKRSTGEVRFDGCDAAELSVQTSTGDVRGTLLTDKVFLVETDTGRRDVPKTTTGGKCEIVTDTGDVKISING